MKNIQKLSQNSSKLLSSSNIITSVYSAVKELVENAIDGGATSVEVKLENSGLDKIEVRDNGCGIEQCDIDCVAKAHYTSKLTSHLDLDQLETYGFRGEALSALCYMATLSITTKTVYNDISQTYSFSKTGDVTTSKPSSSPGGTIVIAENLFKDIPVRKKYYKSEKCKKEELKKIEDLLCAYSCAQIGTRFALYHNRSLIWQKSASTNMKAVLLQVFGSSFVSHLECKSYESVEEEVKIDAFLPRITAPISSITRTQCDRSIVIINKRPVIIKAINKLVQETYSQSVNHDEMKSRFPVYLLNISIPTSKLDVNVDPNKTQVLLHDFEVFLSILAEFLQTSFSKSAIEIPLANSKLETDNGKIQLSSKLQNQASSKPALANADINPISRSISDKSQIVETDLLSNKEFHPLTSKGPSNTLENNSDEHCISHAVPNQKSGNGSPADTLVNQIMSRPAAPPHPSCGTVSNNVNLLKDYNVVNNSLPTLGHVSHANQEVTSCKVQSTRNDSLIINHVIPGRKEDPGNRSHIGGLFTHSASLKEFSKDSPKLQTTFNVDEKTGILKCQVNDEVLPKKRNIEQCLRANSFTNELVSEDKERNTLIKFLREDDCGPSKTKTMPSSNCQSPKTISEQSKTGSLSLSKNVGLILNSCHKNVLDVNKDNAVTITPNFPHLKEIFAQASGPKDSDIRPQQSAPIVPNFSNLKVPERLIDSRIPSDGPSTSAAKSFERIQNVRPEQQPSGSDWSLGKMMNDAGKMIQPVSVLVPSPTKRTLADPNESAEGVKRKKLSSMDKKMQAAAIPKIAMSGFEYFCHSNRLEVQANHPEYNTQEIAQVLFRQWKNLSSERKIIFKELAVKQYQKNVKPKKQLSDTLSQALNKPQKASEAPNNTLNLKNKCKMRRKEAKWNFVMKDLKTLNSTLARNVNEEADSQNVMCTPIKVLSSGVWLCLKEDNLILLNSYRMKEALIYHRLLNTYQLKPNALEIPINLNSELIMDPECWQTLMTMYSENENILNHISLTANGFNVQATKDDVQLRFEVVGIAPCVPSYGIHDLQEILRIIKTRGLSLSLTDYRPSKIKHYLQSETVRISRQSLAVQKHDELVDLLKQTQKYLPINTTECFHGRPFNHCIFNISDLDNSCNNTDIVTC